MTAVQQTLRFVTVADGVEVDRLELLDDGTVQAKVGGGVAAGALATRTRYEDESIREAFAFLADNGWSNGNTMISLEDPGAVRP